MTKNNWDDLLDYLSKVIVQQAEEEVEGEFPSPQEILDKLSQFKSEIQDADRHTIEVKTKLIEYACYRLHDE